MQSALVIDENQDSRFVLRNLLESAGLAVWDAPTGTAAFQVCAAEGHGPDLAVVDLQLANPNGFAVPRALRARYPQMPLILISGTPLDLLVMQNLADPTAVEPYVFLEKPFTARQFRNKLQDSLAILAGQHQHRAKHLP